MARRVWVIGAVGVAIVAFVSAPSSPDETAATSATSASTSPETTGEPPVATPTTSSTTTEPPQTSTTTPTTTPTSSSSVTTVPQARTGRFNGDAFDAVIAAATVERGDMSAGVAVLRSGTVLHTAAFGMENPFEGKAATVRTRFRIASVSKILTAVAIMQLVDDESIELDNPFATQLGLRDEFNDPRLATVTVRQLLSHTSGLAVSRNIFFGHGVDTWQQAARAALGQTLQFDPGTAFQYSNANYCLLGLLIESVTGQPFETVIIDRVLKPIGADAHLAPTNDPAPGDALHASGPDRNYMETLGPAGGWVATPRDVAKLAAALRTESSGVHLLDRATVDAMRAPAPVELPAPAGGWRYGLGLILFADGSWGHTGTIESTHAIVVNRPDGLTVAVLVSGVVPANTDHLLDVVNVAVAAGYSVVEPAATFDPWLSPT